MASPWSCEGHGGNTHELQRKDSAAKEGDGVASGSGQPHAVDNKKPMTKAERRALQVQCMCECVVFKMVGRIHLK